MPLVVDTFAIYQELVPLFGEAAAKGLTTVLGRIVNDLAQTVTKEEFAELKAVVQELATRVEELAEAQKRTEQRVEQLAARMDELAEAQERTEQRVEELAEAQKRTEEEVRSLAVALKQTRKMVGGLSDAVGYTLEDRAIRSLPGLLPELAGLSPEGPFARRWVRDREGELVELNILGYARRGSGEVVTLVGEAKARARVKDVDNLQRLLAQLAGSEVVRGELVGVLVAYHVRPEVEEKARQAGVLLVPSYRLAV
jgi:cell division protein FtsB